MIDGLRKSNISSTNDFVLDYLTIVLLKSFNRLTWSKFVHCFFCELDVHETLSKLCACRSLPDVGLYGDVPTLSIDRFVSCCSLYFNNEKSRWIWSLDELMLLGMFVIVIFPSLVRSLSLCLYARNESLTNVLIKSIKSRWGESNWLFSRALIRRFHLRVIFSLKYCWQAIKVVFHSMMFVKQHFWTSAM